mgnify:FL=1
MSLSIQKHYLAGFIIAFMLFACIGNESVAQSSLIEIPRIPFLSQDGLEDRGGVASSLEILFFLTVLTLTPAIVLLTTSFTRMVIVLGFLRQAIGLQQIPANQIIVGLALFMTVFLMRPVGTQIYQEALRPYMDETISAQEAFPIVVSSMRSFMLRHTRKKDLALFHHIATGGQSAATADDVGTLTLIPAFVISELSTAFQMAFLIYLPFLVVDLVIASVLMSMGMLLLPPVLISLPFKILLFVAVDGWNMIVTSLLRSFSM